MANEDHQKISETVLELVREQLRENGALNFTVLMLDEQGRRAALILVPSLSGAMRPRLV
jgi:hypothetical protein